MADSKNKDEETTSLRSLATAPKRVSGGLILKAKKKKRRIQPSFSTTHGHSQCAANLLSSSSSSSGVPSILSSIPANNTVTEEQCSSSSKTPSSENDEFGDDAFDDNDYDVPSDALLCLQTYTRSSSGCMSETCAYCPIFITEGGDSSSSISSEMNEENEGRRSISTHAAPFLPKKVMLHLLDAQSSYHSTSNNTSSSIAHIEQEIKQLASSNKIRMLQLHGTATARSGGGTIGWRGDGNDDEDVAIIETSVYEAVAGMTLQDFFLGESLATTQPMYKVGMVHSWLISIFLPYFAGKAWFSSGALDSFYVYEYAVANDLKETRASNKKKNGPGVSMNQYTISQMKQMIQHIINAGLLLPRRGVGGGGEGYWFSLPGLGKAAKSIVDGRTNLLRRLQSSRYKEKKRSVLEHEIGRVRGRGDNDDNAAKKSKMEQAGKFVVLDLLAKGWVSIHTNCAGEQFVRLAE